LVIDANLALINRVKLPTSSYQPLRSFLESPEAQGIARQVLASTLTGRLDQHKALIEKQLAMLIQFNIQLDESVSSEVSEEVFQVLVHLSNIIQAQLERQGLEAISEARSGAWSELIVDHLENMDSRATFFEACTPKRLAEYAKFESDLRQQVRYRYRLITPPNLDQARRVPISSLYVAPSLDISRVARRGVRSPDTGEPGRLTRRAVSVGG
jgi:hypothetical protein